MNSGHQATSEVMPFLHDVTNPTAVSVPGRLWSADSSHSLTQVTSPRVTPCSIQFNSIPFKVPYWHDCSQCNLAHKGIQIMMNIIINGELIVI